MAIKSDFSLSSQEIIIDLINRTQKPEKKFTAADIWFEDPVAVDELKTTVKVIGTDNERYEGSKTITYNRVPLSELERVLGITYTVRWYEGITVERIISEINYFYGTFMLADADVVEELIPEPQSTDSKYKLKAHPNSLVWVGEVELNMEMASPDDIMYQLPDPYLPGFNWKKV